jgi:hypothetical protein
MAQGMVIVYPEKEEIARRKGPILRAVGSEVICFSRRELV